MTDTLTVEYVDPAAVATGKNIRRDIRLTGERGRRLVESIRARGVKTPCPATRTSDGIIVLEFGSRRRAAAIEAGKPLPVIVLGAYDDSEAAQLDRLYDQFDENEHREPLTAQEQASFVQALLDFKVPEAQIRKRTGLDKAQIDQARKVTSSERLMAAPPVEDLEMAATIAEFDTAGDDEAVGQLEEAVALGRGQFAHVAQQLTDSQAERFQKRDVLAELAEAGIRVVDEDRDIWQLELRQVRTKDGERITDEDHATCPGHAAYLGSHQKIVDGDWRRIWRPIFICTDPDANGHSGYQARVHGSQDQTPSERQAELEAGRRTRAGNAEWRSATKVRHDYITAAIVPLGSLPKDWPVQAYRLATLASDTYGLGYAINRHHPLGCHWLGLADDDRLNGDKDKLAALCAAATPARAAVVELVLLLAAAEKQAAKTDASWDVADLGYRNLHADHARYLLFLESTGYTLAPIEAHLAHGKRGKYKPQELRGKSAAKAEG